MEGCNKNLDQEDAVAAAGCTQATLNHLCSAQTRRILTDQNTADHTHLDGWTWLLKSSTFCVDLS